MTITDQWLKILRDKKNYIATKDDIFLNHAQYEYKIYKKMGGKRIDKSLEIK